MAQTSISRKYREKITSLGKPNGSRFDTDGKIIRFMSKSERIYLNRHTGDYKNFLYHQNKLIDFLLQESVIITVPKSHEELARRYNDLTGTDIPLDFFTDQFENLESTLEKYPEMNDISKFQLIYMVQIPLSAEAQELIIIGFINSLEIMK